MAYKNRGSLYEDPLAELGSDLSSDVSDVKPEDIDKILKSSIDLDARILKDTLIPSQRERGSHNLTAVTSIPQSAKMSLVGDALADIDLPSSLDESALTPAAKMRNVSALFGLEPTESSSGAGNAATSSPSNWLGLKEHPVSLSGTERVSTSTTGKKLQSARSLTSKGSNVSLMANRAVKTAETTSQTGKLRVNILDDLFKDTGLKTDMTEKKFNEMGNSGKSGGYTPTSVCDAGNRRTDKLSSIKMDWLLSSAAKTDEIKSQTDVHSKPSSKDLSASVSDFVGLKDRTKKLENPQKPETSADFISKKDAAYSSATPDWLTDARDNSGVNQSQAELPTGMTNEEETLENKQECGGFSLDVVSQLTKVQAQLIEATRRRNLNFQLHMQELIEEVKRVGGVYSHENLTSEKIEREKSDTKEILDKEKDELEITVRKQDRVIQDLELEISRLHNKITQIEFKMNSVELMKDLEIESIKKANEFEIISCQSKFNRLKATFEEVVTEYEGKIEHFKAKLDESEKLHKERIDALQAEKMADFEKLREFHWIALEQAASITVNSAGLPIKTLTKPGDEREITEREALMMEKERQVEILKQKVELEKSELDELIEREKMRQIEKERESRRILMEVQFKEEMITKEFDRKKEQLDFLQKQIHTIREEAMKEQSDLAQEKLLLAAEKARLEAAAKLEKSSDDHFVQTFDATKARFEMEAALETARQARELADKERRRQVELRKTVEEIAWEQKDKEQQLEMRERHLTRMLQEAEAKRQEGMSALDEAKGLKDQLTAKQKEIDAALKLIETKEKLLAKERSGIAKERVDLEKKRLQLEIFLPELSPVEELMNAPKMFSANKDYVDPKALIMRLKAEKDLEYFVASPTKSNYF